jgi:hypothetical protein
MTSYLSFFKHYDYWFIRTIKDMQVGPFQSLEQAIDYAIETERFRNETGY